MSDREREDSSIIKIEGKRSKYKLYLRQQLGRGGFAAVYKGIRCSDGTEVAIKKITKRFDYGATEVEHMEMLSNDRNNLYTVKLLDYYNDNNKEIYLILPYYKHGSLRDYIRKTNKSLETKTAANIMLQLVVALKYLHEEKQIMHRDLTSANVMIKDITNGNIDVLLGDFGLAKEVTNNAKQKQTICGTKGYMPPEVNKGRYRKGDEVYSLGGILYFMLTAREPDAGQERDQLKYVKDGLARTLLERLWQKSPDDRPTFKEITSSQFLNEYLSVIVKPRSSSKQRSKSRECTHRLGPDENGNCSRCREPLPNGKSVKASHDSAYGSNNRASNRDTRHASRNTEGTTNQASSRNVEGSRKPSRTPSVRSRQTDNEKRGKEIQWPVPSFKHFKPSTTSNKQIDEYRIKSPKGRFIIVDSSLLVFEALSSDKERVEYIFEVKMRGGNQDIDVYEPTKKKQLLPDIKADLIQNKSYKETISRASQLAPAYTPFYNSILKALEKFYSRNAKINFAYVNGNKKYTAKLMYDGSFRFIFGDKIFWQKPGTSEDDFQPTNECSGTRLNGEERRLFIETRNTLLDLDRTFTARFGSFYMPFNMNQKQL